ncbi:MAG: flagellar biosynthesis protein FlhB [Burkholderiales bacterium]|nr:flagellar biosynthesis protein FlhB [Burkholderiales bacterium]
MADSSTEKHLPPTEKRLRDAREKGQVARSRDLGHLAVLAAGLVLLIMAMPQLVAWLRGVLATGLSFDARSVASTGFMTDRLAALVLPAVALALGLGTVMALVSLAAAVASGGWVFTLKAIAPDFGRINPLSGLGRIVSKAQLGDMAKAVFLAVLLAIVGGNYLYRHLQDFALAQAMPLPGAFAAVGQTMVSGLWLLMLVLAVFAVVDVPLQRFMHVSRLKMSHEDVKQEHKQSEGNPEIKGQIKQRMREMSRKRMLAAVPQADLVVMNPTHYAVALKYDEGKMAAPRIVALGADLLALRIRDVARDAKVPVLTAPPLARALYAHGELDREIPLALYSAVAQVLAYVFQLRSALIGKAPMPADLASVPVPPELDPHNPAAAAALAKATAARVAAERDADVAGGDVS